MKSLFAAIILLSTSIGLSATLTASEVNQKCLDALLKNKDSITLDGDVHSTETLTSILNQASSDKRISTSVTNECTEIRKDGIYECHLTIKKNLQGMTAETDIAYQVGLYNNGETATLLTKKVYVSRGD
ncbi:MAG: hypothetical protein ACM3MG_08445 [Bacillota bacterium]